MPWKLQSPLVYPLPRNEVWKNQAATSYLLMQTTIKGRMASEIDGIREKDIFKSKSFAFIFEVSSAARTNITPGLVMLHSSPQ